MQGAEERNIAYLCKLKQTPNVKKLIARPELGGSGYGTTAERLEQEAAGSIIAATAERYCGAGQARQAR